MKYVTEGLQQEVTRRKIITGRRKNQNFPELNDEELEITSVKIGF